MDWIRWRHQADSRPNFRQDRAGAAAEPESPFYFLIFLLQGSKPRLCVSFGFGDKRAKRRRRRSATDANGRHSTRHSRQPGLISESGFGDSGVRARRTKAAEFGWNARRYALRAHMACMNQPTLLVSQMRGLSVCSSLHGSLLVGISRRAWLTRATRDPHINYHDISICASVRVHLARARRAEECHSQTRDGKSCSHSSRH